MKKMRHIWTMLAMLVVLTCALATTALADSTAWDGSATTDFTIANNGDGSAEKPWEISTGAELAYLAQEVNKGTAAYVSAYYILTDDIVLNEGDSTTNQWAPIGDDYSHSFNGTFDGNNKTVSGLAVSSGTGSRVGLFGSVGVNAVVKNLSVDIGSNSINGSYYVGGVVGNNEGTVENCSVTGTGTITSTHNFAGGVVGRNLAGGTVTNCASAVTVSSTTTGSDIAYAGGVVGYNSGTVENCYATGAVSAIQSGTADAYAGGVVGYVQGTDGIVTNCYATGAVTASGGSGTNYAGGVVGRNSGTVTACYWLNTASQMVGGSEQNTKLGVGGGSGSSSTTGFSGTGTDYMGTYSSLLNALNGWVDTQASTAYCTWEQGDSTPYLSDYWRDLDYAVTTTDGTYKETDDTEIFTGTLNITAPGTYNIAMAEGKTSSDKCIFIYSTAGDVTLIFNNVTIETYGGTISTQSGYTGTLTIQGVVNVTSTNGKTIDVQYGTLAISDPNTVVTATGGVDTALYATTAPTLSDNLVAKAKASADGTTYDQAVTWSGNTYQYNSSDAKYIQIAYEAPASTSSGSSSSVTKYTSTVTSADNGSISVSNSSPTYGTTVTVTATPDEGYEVGSITVTNAIGTELTVTDNGDGTYSYKQLGSKVTITVTFVAIETEVEEEEEGALPFTDLDESEYYMDAIAWAVENGITTGKTDTTFAPQDINTRAQAVTFLWRAMGSPESSIENPFTDLDEEEYYYEAVLWAVEMGITVGTTDSTFSPDTDCTRAHIITFLWRTMEQLMADTENPFTDLEENEYYVQAVLWAVENAITTGTTETTFSPYNDCTRAQIITFLYRCLAE